MTDHHGGTTIISEDREGPATALIMVLALMLVGFLIWFFAFSGVVFDRGGSSGTTNVTNIEDNTGNTGTNPASPLPSANPS